MIRRVIGKADKNVVRPMADDGRFVVTIDGKPYANFRDRAYAEQAVGMWLGEIDGNGMPIPQTERAKHAWKAILGRRVEIVER
jgi:hypothetical protein